MDIPEDELEVEVEFINHYEMDNYLVLLLSVSSEKNRKNVFKHK